MSLFNIDKIPEKETTTLQCKICKGIMEEQTRNFASKIFNVLTQNKMQTKRYCCTECKKELFIRERK
jgi:tRNA U54 and U55 pseudouridine synthase Pus10